MLQRLQDIGGKKSMNRIYKVFENILENEV